MINLKNILLEGIKEKSIEDFIRNTIKNTVWENKIFIAGGKVRDELLGIDSKDIDLVANAPDGGLKFGDWFTKKIGNYKEGSNPVTFPKFGVSKFNLNGIYYNGVDLSNLDIECVMPRSEKYTSGSRKPDVKYSGLQADAERRDSTVNSLFKNISTGEIIDLTGKGLSDLKRGIMRTPLDPDKTFTDDPLRMLRFVRQSIKYKWDIPLYILKSIKKNASQLPNISNERIRDELNKMLMTSNPHKAVKLLKITGLLQFVIPELIPAIKMTQNKHHNKTVFGHTLDVLSKTPPELISRISGLLHDIGKTMTRKVIDNEVHFYGHENVGSEMTREILTRLKYPNNIIEPVVLAVKNHMRLKQGGKEGEIVSDKALRKLSVDLGDHLNNILSVIHADNLSHAPGSEMPEQIPNIIKRIEVLKNTIPQKGQKSPVSGDDLKNMGIPTGPLYKELLNLVKDKQLESPNTSKKEYLELIKNYLKNKI